MENQNPQTPPQNIPSEQSQPVSSPINPPVGQKSKFPLSVIVGIILILLIVGSAAGFYIFKPQIEKLVAKPTPTPRPGCFYQKVQCIQAPCPPVLVCPNLNPTPTTNPTANPDLIGANWKTYANSQYGFSIKYPPSYNCGFSMQKYYDTPHNLSKLVGVFGCSEGELKMTGGVTGDNVTLVIYPKDFEPIYQFSEDRGDTIILAGQKVPKRYGLNGTIIDFGPFIHNEQTYVFEYDEPYVPNGRADQTNLNLFLSTFKFTQ